MASENKVISSLALGRIKTRLKATCSRIIRGSEVKPGKRVRVVGGDFDEQNQETPPAIIIEKENDQIAKIIVKCPCGRHSELVCEYNVDDVGDAQESEEVET